MKKHFDKALWGLIMIITLAATMTAGSFFSAGKENAAATQKQYTQSISSEDLEVDLSNPKTAVRTTAIKVYYYRVFNGWLERRLWNRTYGRWEWSTWHKVQKVN